ncbi:MAG: LON peptidase substrate-binding domain-containing protein [Chlorobi bacterium]|nr:LON peptidase substrate-binding domain-containing protein [Chlorobiota bacterium]
MATVVEQIGLFPLGTVLFPGAHLPLHIVELRYRELIGQCLQQNQPFGINLFDEGNLHLIGCTAMIGGVLRHYNDGRLDIVVVGQRRYVLRSFDTETKPYFVGTVEYLENRADAAIDEQLYRRCAEQYNRLIERVFSNYEEFTVSLETVPSIKGSTPSFFMAQKAGLTLLQKQVVLSLDSENERLEFLLSHFHQLLPRLDKIEEVAHVARMDGYLSSRWHDGS